MFRKLCIACGMAAGLALQAETGYDVWLRYAALDGEALRQARTYIPAVVSVFGDSELIVSGRDELIRGARGMVGRTLRQESGLPKESGILLGTLDALRQAAPAFNLDGALKPEGYWLKTIDSRGTRYIVVAGADERGVLYGAFALLRKTAMGEQIHRDLSDLQLLPPD